jgi:hypothetical protein
MSAAEILERLEWAEDGLPVGWPEDQGVRSAGPEVLAWTETTLSQPDGDRAGEHWQWRESQSRFVLWWYALDEEGVYLWRRAQVVLPKGSGKSPMAAALACAELAGPGALRQVGRRRQRRPGYATASQPRRESERSLDGPGVRRHDGPPP